jgi:hypothetical protein
MEIPANAKVTELTTSYIWFDDDGVMYSKPKAEAPPEQTQEQTDEQMAKFKKLIGGKKVCMVLEANANSRPPNKEERDRAAEALNEVTRAMAIITTSPLSRMIANLFFGLKPPPYPVKMVADEKEGKEWIKQYL